MFSPYLQNTAYCKCHLLIFKNKGLYTHYPVKTRAKTHPKVRLVDTISDVPLRQVLQDWDEQVQVVQSVNRSAHRLHDAFAVRL